MIPVLQIDNVRVLEVNKEKKEICYELTLENKETTTRWIPIEEITGSFDHESIVTEGETGVLILRYGYAKRENLFHLGEVTM